MKIPVDWLLEYVDLGDTTVEELTYKLTMLGHEVVGVSDGEEAEHDENTF